MAEYHPSDIISGLLDKSIKSFYTQAIEQGANYFIRYSQEGATKSATVTFVKEEWRGISLWELEHKDNSTKWFMVKDWND